MDVYPQRGAEVSALRQYYRDHTLFLSPEWILKELATVGCLVSAALMLYGSSCGGGVGGVTLGAGAASAFTLAIGATRLPARAPTAWLLVDITTSTVMGVLLMVNVVMIGLFCEMNTTIASITVPLGMASSALALASAAATYRAATKRLDAAMPAREPRTPLPPDHEV